MVGKRSSKLALLAGAVALLSGILGWSAEAQAANATCNPVYHQWQCHWEDNPTPPDTRIWFTTPGGNNHRNWGTLQVGDYHGGNVAKKCVGVKRASDSEIVRLDCGDGLRSVAVSSGNRPSRPFVFHDADSARNIFGSGTHF